jgi:hypothetical protein
LQGDFVVTTNAGRAIYIVYSLLTIPIITILVSLMSDTLLSSLQKKAEHLGVRSNEDQRYNARDAKCREKGPRWKRYTRKLFRGKLHIIKEEGESPPPPPEDLGVEDLEAQIKKTTSGDEVLEDEVVGEVEHLERGGSEEVDSELGIGPREASVIERDIRRGDDEDGEQHPRRRARARFTVDTPDLEDAIREDEGASPKS